MTTAQLVPAIVIPLVAWRLYSRFRRSVGRQKLRPKRTILSIAIMALALVMISMSVLHLGAALWPLPAGLVAGTVIGLLGCKLTRFETIDGEKSYTPNAWLGITVSMLLVARVAYRLVLLYSTGEPVPAATPDLGHSPLTLALLGLTFGYYLTYNTAVFLSLKAASPMPL